MPTPPSAPSSPPSRGSTPIRLLDAARDLIAEGGWSAVSSRAIALRAGANLAAINYHFGTQADLLRAVVDRSTERLVRDYGPHHLAGDPAAFLRAAIAIIPSMRDDPDVRVVYSAILRSSRDPDLHRLLRGKLEGIRGLFRRLLADRVDDDDLLDGWVILLAALVDGLLIHVLLDEETDVERAGEALAMALTGLLGASSVPAGT